MANNRIYLECDRCKQWVFFYKYYPSCMGYTPKDNNLEEFVAEHLYKCNENENFLDKFPFSLVLDHPSGEGHKTDGTHDRIVDFVIKRQNITKEELQRYE